METERFAGINCSVGMKVFIESRGTAIKTRRQQVFTIVLVENLHIHLVLTSPVVDTNSDDMMEMN
jgi:hypothetical protein